MNYIADNFHDMFLGAGSVTNREDTSYFLKAGAHFIVSPGIVKEMARLCNSSLIPWFPGCATVTEILEAVSLGAEIVKIFPANTLGGVNFLKAIKAPLPSIKLMPTGGVNPDVEELKQWKSAGAYCVGMGSKLFQKKEASYDFSMITKLSKASISVFS